MIERIKSFLKLLYRYWMIFAKALGWVNSRIILTVFYFVIFSPLSLIMRLFGKDFLAANYDNPESYWLPKEKILDKNQYLKPY
jgi:hypothetical protein